jgi:acylaminoacyl-peptidase
MDLIPRKLLFGNPERMAPRISPDGAWIAWIAPRDGVMNIWIAPAADLAAARPLTASPRPLNAFMWAYDDRHILYSDDTNGNENRRVWAVTIDTAEARMLTPELGVAAEIAGLTPAHPNTVLVFLNQRDPIWHDLWSIDLATGHQEIVFENTGGYNTMWVDWNLDLRLLRRENREAGGSTLYRWHAGEAEPLFDIAHEDDTGTYVAGFERDGAHYHLVSTVGRNTGALFRVDAATGARTLIAEDDKSDLTSTLRDPATGHILAVSFTFLRREWRAIDPAVAPDLARIAEAAGSLDFNIYSQTEDGTRWVLLFYGPTQPAAYFLYDRRTATLTPLFDLRPDLAPYRFAAMHPVVIPSRDGLDLVSYLTLPSGIAADRPPSPLPMVLTVHGGPWGRDGYYFDGIHQWLADRGYAVLSVNYRASTGFGKSFVNAGDREHAGKMHDDLIDAVEWAVHEGIAHRDRVAIRGASYGGYATLVGLTFTPEVFCCGCSLVGISNLVTLMETLPPYWHAVQNLFYRRYADPRTEDGKAWLWAHSPLSRVDQITKPLLLGHGQNDVRCKVAESDQIAAAMRERGLPVRYLLYPDEGHGFTRPENRLSFLAMEEAFFAEHLGGACEPVGDDLAGSSMVEA